MKADGSNSLSIEAFHDLREQLHTLSGSLTTAMLRRPFPTLVSGMVPFCNESLLDQLDTLPGRSVLLHCLIVRALNDRIFRPFLFTVGRHQEPADQRFKDISQSLVQRSTEQEANWRQQISHAAYTAPNAQQCVNRTAASIVEEIMDSVDAMMYVRDRTTLRAGVQNIVKLAAESWRYARSVFLLSSFRSSEPYLSHGLCRAGC